MGPSAVGHGPHGLEPEYLVLRSAARADGANDRNDRDGDLITACQRAPNRLGGDGHLPRARQRMTGPRVETASRCDLAVALVPEAPAVTEDEVRTDVSDVLGSSGCLVGARAVDVDAAFVRRAGVVDTEKVDVSSGRIGWP
jgi:hypothetical protein